MSPFYKVAYGSRGFPNGGQYLVDPDGSNHRFFSAATGTGAFDWTPDGLKNVYVFATSNGDGTYRSVLFIRNQNDDIFPVDVPDDFPVDPAISNDGERIVYAYRGAGNASFMRVVDLQGNELADLGEGAQPTWSPDGSKIAYTKPGEYTIDCGGATGTYTVDGLAVISSTGGASGWLVEPGVESGDGSLAGVSSPDWSPDGTMIAFDAIVDVRELRSGVCVRLDNTDDVDVYTVGSGGGAPTNLTDAAEFANDAYPSDPFDGNPSFSPDGELLAFASSRNEPVNGLIHTLWVMDVGGSAVRRRSTSRSVRSTAPTGRRHSPRVRRCVSLQPIPRPRRRVRPAVPSPWNARAC